MQNIVYSEYLPILLGQAKMESLEIYIKNMENTKYDPNVDPSILNSFATASFR